jgi:hypothetical protein
MEALVNAVSDLLAAILGRFGHVGRARGRANIREDLDLLGQLRDSPEFGPESLASGYLEDHITTEVARYSGAVQEQKRKRPWPAIVLGLLITAVLVYLFFKLNQGGFSWFSLLPGLGATLMLLTVAQLFTEDKAQSETDGNADAPHTSSPTSAQS